MPLHRYIAAAAAVFAVQLTAQTPFHIVVRTGNDVAIVSSGATFNLAAPAVGSYAEATLIIRYDGKTAARLAAPQAFGPVTIQPAAPVTLAPGISASFRVGYTASRATAVSSLIEIPYTEDAEIQPGSPSGLPQVTRGVLSFVATGTAPDLVLAYVSAGDGNIVPAISPIPLPDSLPGTSAETTVQVFNSGGGPGTVQGIFISGAGFTATNVPRLPAQVSPGSELRFGIRFSGQRPGSSTGILQVQTVATTLRAEVTARTVNSFLSYVIETAGTNVALEPGGTIRFPAVSPGSRSLLTLRFLNVSREVLRIPEPHVSGQAFGIVNPPVGETRLLPGYWTSVIIAFTPPHAGEHSGRLRILDDTFQLESRSGNGLQYSFVNANGTAAPVLPGASLLAGSAVIGAETSMSLVILNESESPAEIRTITMIDPSSSFPISPPALPALLDPARSIVVPVRFAPRNPGPVTATLSIDGDLFTLSGSGTLPVLSEVEITGSPVQQPSFAQPTVGIRLQKAYPIALSGLLNLDFYSEYFADDPAIQFSTGGRRVTFEIPANMTDAIFANGSREVRLQSGTVAGAIRVSASLSALGQDLTAASQPVRVFNISPSPPRLLTIRLAERTSDSITLAITGFTPTRSLSKLELTFSTTHNTTPSSARFTVALDSAASLYFRDPESAAFGGQFTLLLPIGFGTSGSSIASPAFEITQVEAAVSNEIGLSNVMTLSLR